jgi:hypothetical protein
VSSAVWSQGVGRGLLDCVLPQAWLHTQGVARRAREAAPLTPDHAHLVEAAAWLHDVGRSPSIARTGFCALDGARHLREVTGASRVLLGLVAHHCGALVEARHRGLDAELEREFPLAGVAPAALLDVVTFCDLTTAANGDTVDVEARLTELGEEHPPGTVVGRALAEQAPGLRDRCAAVGEALAAGRVLV